MLIYMMNTKYNFQIELQNNYTSKNIYKISYFSIGYVICFFNIYNKRTSYKQRIYERFIPLLVKHICYLMYVGTPWLRIKY